MVLGMGPGGEDVAGTLAEAGLSVVGIEARLLGGECPYWGCVPSKMMIRAADLLAEGTRIPGMSGTSTVASRLAARRPEDPGRGDRQLGRQGRGRPVHRQGRHGSSAAVARLTGSRRDHRGDRGAAAGDPRSRGDRDRDRHAAIDTADRRSRRLRRTGPTVRRSRPRRYLDRSSSSAAARSARNSHRCSPGSALA